jgi:amidase
MGGFTDYHQYDAVGLAELVHTGAVSPVDLIDEAIARIEAQDGVLNGVVRRRFERAREEARAPRPGPFGGVPYLLKDLHISVPGEPTAGGTRILTDRARVGWSTMARRIEQAGWIVVGRTNTPELGIMGITESRAFGPARNPWNPEFTSGGSSGGSGTAVAAGYVPAAHASDGGGSIRIPASHCGLVGLKPTRARTPAGPEQGEGWMGLALEHTLTRTVRDSAAILDATAGPEPGAPYEVRPPERPYRDEIGREPGRLRIGFSTGTLLAGVADPEVAEGVRAAAAMASALGHEVEEAVPQLPWNELRMAYFIAVAAGVAADVHEAARAAGRPARARDFEPTTWTFARIGHALSAAQVEESRRTVQRAGFQYAEFATKYDVFLSATCARPPARVGALYPDAGKERLMKLLHLVGTRNIMLKALDSLAAEALSATPNTQLANLLGIPAISLPTATSTAGLPIGTMWHAAFGREDVLFRLASQIEAAYPWSGRRPPASRG